MTKQAVRFKIKTSYMKQRIILRFLFHYISTFMIFPGAATVNGQCLSSQLQSTAYFTGSCGNLIFQSSIGSMSNSFGTCGNLYFSPPITGSDISTNVQPISYEEVVILPNPAVDRLEILYDERQTLKAYTIFRSTGQILIQNQNRDIQRYVDLQSVMPGIYFIQLNFEGMKPVTRKFIKIN